MNPSSLTLRFFLLTIQIRSNTAKVMQDKALSRKYQQFPAQMHIFTDI